MKRPIGVTILVLLHIIAACAIFYEVVFPFIQLTLSDIKNPRYSDVVGGVWVVVVFSGLMAAIETLVGIAPAIIGFGLWKLHNWARLLELDIAVLAMVFLIYIHLDNFFKLNIYPSASDTKIVLALIGYTIFFVWYMLRPNVRKAFGVKGILK